MVTERAVRVLPHEAVGFLAEHSLERRDRARVARMATDAGHGRKPDALARVAEGMVDQDREGVHRQRRRLALLATERVQGFAAHAGYGVVDRLIELRHAAVVRMVVHKRGALPPDGRAGMGQALDNQVERRLPCLIERSLGGESRAPVARTEKLDLMGESRSLVLDRRHTGFLSSIVQRSRNR